jgi:hypothetical protein
MDDSAIYKDNSISHIVYYASYKDDSASNRDDSVSQKQLSKHQGRIWNDLSLFKCFKNSFSSAIMFYQCPGTLLLRN